MSETETIAPPTNTRILSHIPKEIYTYPTSTHTIRLGNGGAGPCGIFKAIAKDYHEAYPDTASSIAWYQNISPLTLEALHAGNIDISLTYERDQEEQAIQKGRAQGSAELIFNDHFILVGPTSNPAGINKSDSPQQAFEKVLHAGRSIPGRKLMLSRNDHSATNLKERAIWESIGFTFGHDHLPDWYVGHTVFPQDALLEADRDGLYTLIDHGTFGMLRNRLQSTEVYVHGGDLLRNPCKALLSPYADDAVKRFLEYLQSDRGQEVIAHFGEELYGEPLYTCAVQLDFQ